MASRTRAGKPEPSGGIITSMLDGYAVYAKDDGNDYAAAWNELRLNGFRGATLMRKSYKSEIYRAAVAGRDVVVKIDRKQPDRLETRFWSRICGPYHSRTMRRVNKAVRDGCALTADMYLVAEKVEGGICRESHIITEFLTGSCMWEVAPTGKEAAAYSGAIRDAMLRLHDHDLVLGDLGYGNVMVTQDGIKFIDLTWNGPVWLGKAQDIIRLWQEYGIRLPLRGVMQRLAVTYTLAKYAVQDCVRRPGKAEQRFGIYAQYIRNKKDT